MDAKLNIAGWISEQMGGVREVLDLLPSNSTIEAAAWNAQRPPGNESTLIPTQVNCVGKAANLYYTGYQLSGSSYVISKYISNTWLWDRVRVSGGAYGSFCDFDIHYHT